MRVFAGVAETGARASTSTKLYFLSLVRLLHPLGRSLRPAAYPDCSRGDSSGRLGRLTAPQPLSQHSAVSVVRSD